MRQAENPIFKVLGCLRSQISTTRRRSADKWRRWVSALVETNVLSSTPTSGLEKGPEVLPEEKARARAKVRAKREPPHLIDLMRRPRDLDPEQVHLPDQERRFATTGRRETANVEKNADGPTLHHANFTPTVVEEKHVSSRTMISPHRSPPPQRQKQLWQCRARQWLV